MVLWPSYHEAERLAMLQVDPNLATNRRAIRIADPSVEYMNV